METIILPRIQQIAKSDANTMLSCSAIMFVVSAFDVYKTDIYNIEEDLVNEVIINQSITNIKKVLPGGQEENDHFSNSVIISILESYSILMKGMFSQLFTPEQLTEILSIFFSIPESKTIGDSQISNQIDTISSLVAKNVTPQISLHSLFNIFDIIAIHPAEFNNTEDKLNIYCQRYFNCLSKIFRILKKDFIEEYYEGISKFFHKSFLIPQTWEKNTQTPLTSVFHIHNWVLSSFKAFVLKLNEIQLKPLFAKLVKWASKPLNKSVKPVKDLDKLYIFFKVVNCLLETLMSIFTPYLSQYINLLTELFNEAIEDNHTKSMILFMSDFTDANNSRLNIVMVVDTLLECVRLNYYYDTESTIPVEYFQKISDSIIHVMDFYVTHNSMNKTQYLEWIRTVYQRVIVDVLDSLDQVEVTKDFLDDLLKNSKHENTSVRLAIMRITEAIIIKLEERFLVLLSDVLPYISESLEDPNEEVEMAARNVIHKIEGMTGESIQQYLK